MKPACIILAAAFISPAACLANNPIERSEALLQQSHRDAGAAQKTIDKIDRQQQQMLQRYLENERSADAIDAYNRQVKKLLKAQHNEIDELQKQIISLAQTERTTLPMLQAMIEQLGQFIAQDTPFLQAERSQRVARLQRVLDRADISLAEKYRQILQAYSIEMQYGRTLEAYQDFAPNSDSTQGIYFRLGRVALYFQSLDGKQASMWLGAQKRWQAIDEREQLNRAIAIAEQQRNPELLTLPMPPLASRPGKGVKP